LYVPQKKVCGLEMLFLGELSFKAAECNLRATSGTKKYLHPKSHSLRVDSSGIHKAS